MMLFWGCMLVSVMWKYETEFGTRRWSSSAVLKYAHKWQIIGMFEHAGVDEPPLHGGEETFDECISIVPSIK